MANYLKCEGFLTAALLLSRPSWSCSGPAVARSMSALKIQRRQRARLGLCHGRVLEAGELFDSRSLLLSRVGHLERERVVPEAQVLGRHKAAEEDVDALRTHARAGWGQGAASSRKVRMVLPASLPTDAALLQSARALLLGSALMPSRSAEQGRNLAHGEGHGDHAVRARPAVQAGTWMHRCARRAAQRSAAGHSRAGAAPRARRRAW